MKDYEVCENCGAVLVINLLTDTIYCKNCGYSPYKESEKKEVTYIG